MHTIEQVPLAFTELSARPPIVETHRLPPVQSCLFGHTRAEVVYDCP